MPTRQINGGRSQRESADAGPAHDADDLWSALGEALGCAAFEYREQHITWSDEITVLLDTRPDTPAALAEHAAPADRARLIQAFDRCCSDEPVNVRFRCTTSRGTRTFELLVREQEDCHRGLFRDVTEDPQRIANDHFQYIVSHDLMEPIRTIRSFIGLTLDDHAQSLDDEGRYFLELASEGAVRMKSLLDGLLRWTRLGANAPIEAIDPASCARDATVSLASLLEETLVDLTILPMPLVQANPILLRTAFENLMSNAVRFRSPDRPLAIRIDGEAVNGDGRQMVRIEVSDNGIGVPEQQRESAFEVFRRLMPTKHPRGAGMGLAIVRRIVEQSGGTIHLQDPPDGKGVVVVILLPGA